MNRTIPAAVAVLLLAGCGSASAASTPTPQLGTMVGTLTLHDANRRASQAKLGDPCLPSDGYGDIPRAQVVVRDGAGKIVASSALSSGKVSREGWLGGQGSCEFAFAVPSVPLGLGTYTVEVSHRGQIVVQEANLSSVKLTLGT